MNKNVCIKFCRSLFVGYFSSWTGEVLLVVESPSLEFLRTYECQGQSEFSHRITEWVRLKGITISGYLVQRPCSNRIIPELMDWIVCRWFWKISTAGDYTNSLGNPFQCEVTCTVKTFFPVFRWNFLYAGFCPLPLFYCLAPLSTIHPLATFPSDTYTPWHIHVYIHWCSSLS